MQSRLERWSMHYRKPLLVLMYLELGTFGLGIAAFWIFTGPVPLSWWTNCGLAMLAWPVPIAIWIVCDAVLDFLKRKELELIIRQDQRQNS